MVLLDHVIPWKHKGHKFDATLQIIGFNFVCVFVYIY